MAQGKDPKKMIPKKSVLHVIPYFSFYPSTNGGALRCYHISQQLSKYFDVTILTHQPKDSFFEHPNANWNTNIEIVNPRPLKVGKLNSIIYSLTYRWKRKNLFEQANINFLLLEPELRRLLKRKKFDVVVFEHLEAEKLSRTAQKISPETIRIVDQHNVDHLLFIQEHPKEDYGHIKKQESTLYKRNQRIWACSENDRDIFKQINNHRIQVDIIPNGVDTLSKTFHHPKDYTQKSLLFCGALDSAANTDALKWFYNDIWPALKKEISEIKITIIGKSSDYSKFEYLKYDSQIRFVGEVDQVDAYYQQNNIAIVPLRIGSGTRLKILEAMSFGNPVISTSLGAEGLQCNPNQDILIANSESEFISAIKMIIGNQVLSEELTLNARKLVESKYSWEVIGELVKTSIDKNWHTEKYKHPKFQK